MKREGGRWRERQGRWSVWPDSEGWQRREEMVIDGRTEDGGRKARRDIRGL